LLQCLVPWAVLAALGGLRFRQWLLSAPGWMRHPAWGLLILALPIDLCLAVFGARIPGPAYMVPSLMVLVPILVLILGWGLTRPDGRWALGTTFTLLVAAYCVVYSYKTSYLDRYREDTAFLRRLQESSPPGKPIYVLNDLCPLEGFRILFYLGNQARWLHNATFLLDEKIPAGEVYVITRGRNEPHLACYGTTQVLRQSEYTRGEKSIGDRWTLFQLRFADNRKPQPGNLYINPMQVSGRMLGPYLQEEPRGDNL
jgi:hypothetical protein